MLTAFHHTLIHAFYGCLRLVGPLGELWLVLPIAASLVVWCLVCRQWRGAIAIVVATLVTLAFVVLMKLIGTLLGLPWNPNWKWISTLFPSGHMAMGTVVYGALTVCVGRAMPRLGIAVAGLVIVLIVMLGIQRVVFDVHPILDVIGGAALGGLGVMGLLRIWPSGRLHPAGLPGVAVAVALILHTLYGRAVPSTQMLLQAAARIHAVVATVKGDWNGN